MQANIIMPIINHQEKNKNSEAFPFYFGYPSCFPKSTHLTDLCFWETSMMYRGLCQHLLYILTYIYSFDLTSRRQDPGIFRTVPVLCFTEPTESRKPQTGGQISVSNILFLTEKSSYLE